MSDGGSGSGGSGFDWGLRPGGASEEPPSEPAATPEPAPPAEPPAEPPAPEQPAPAPTPAPSPAEPEATQLIRHVEPPEEPQAPAPDTFATDIFATDPPPPFDPPPPVDPAPAADPDSAIDALFGETQFREYEPGVLDPNESPFAARTAQLDPESPDAPATRAGVSRTQKVLLWVAGGVVAVLALVALFFVGTRLPALLGPAPAVVISTPSATPSPTSTVKPVGPVANGVHPWTALLGGECLDPYTNPWAEKFTVVDCTKPHPAQMVFRGTFDTSSDPSYPGVEKLQAQISLLCAAPGVINLAAAGAYSDIELQGSYAVNSDEWAEGEHDYFCFVSRKGGQPLTGSVAVPPPAAP